MKRASLNLFLAFTAMVFSVAARANPICSTLLLRVLEISPKPQHADEALFLDAFRAEVDERFAQLTPDQQMLLLKRVASTVFVPSETVLFDASRDGYMFFNENVKGAYLPLPAIFHEWVHAVDMVKRDTQPWPVRWLKMWFHFSDKALEQSAYNAQYDLIQRMRSNPDHPRLVSDLIAREWKLDEEQREFLHKFFTGLDRLSELPPGERLASEEFEAFALDEAEVQAFFSSLSNVQHGYFLHYGESFRYDRAEFLRITLARYRTNFMIFRALATTRLGMGFVAIYAFYKAIMAS
ncbi:MAG TPA: hypothetical protein VM901_02140 [Bdellovibrionota bacterium]|nr:hypothetical protein [Bdellovibrionota bacterium]